MIEILVAVDSFKGTLSSRTIAETLQRLLPPRLPQCRVRSLPVADGGEGLVDCFATLGWREVRCTVTGPKGQPVEATYLLHGEDAMLEMAQAAGLPLCDPLDPMGATTYGVGEMIAHAATQGATHFLLGLGGSATTDAGCGMAAALGARFLDANGRSFVPTGGTLTQIAEVRYPPAYDVVGLCDVRNPLYGDNGAACVYAPQKGATPAQVEALDRGLRHVAAIASGDPTLPGAGAAGGMGYGITCWLGGSLRRGIDAVLDAVGFDAMARRAQWIVTGEGCLDSQSVQGKVIDGIVARRQNARVLALVGKNKLPDPNAHHIETVFETSRYLNGESIYTGAQRTLERTIDDLADYIRTHSI